VKISSLPSESQKTANADFEEINDNVKDYADTPEKIMKSNDKTPKTKIVKIWSCNLWDFQEGIYFWMAMTLCQLMIHLGESNHTYLT